MSEAALHILLSRTAMARLAPAIAQVASGRPHALVAPDEPDAALAEVAFVTRDVTGLSTKDRILPHTQQVYDAFARAPQLRWVHVHSAGSDREAYQVLMARGVAVTTSSGANAPVVAQAAVLGVLALARQWPSLAAAQREHRWAPLIETGLPRDLAGQQAVIVGWGPVGREIGRLLEAIGLRVLAVRSSGTPSLHEALPQADWLVLACPLTAATRRMIGAAELARLPSHCGLVNVARGEVVNEAALIEALRERRIAGAYLDVFEQEPLPATSALWDMPNVIVTPHSAGFSDGNEPRVDRMFLDNLARWMRGERLANVAVPRS